MERPFGFENRDPYLLETSVPGIFAAGDIRHASTKQVVSAAGEGSSAALEIRDYLKHGVVVRNGKAMVASDEQC